ncbi:MAG TPA: MFS transporter [Solirubrobacteraceae bacterium]|nr:MFS transporter [Solirubrobacteraceae bacterium]
MSHVATFLSQHAVRTPIPRRRRASEDAHLAEQAYAAELAHAGRVRASERKSAGAEPARQTRAVRPARAQRAGARAHAPRLAREAASAEAPLVPSEAAAAPSEAGAVPSEAGAVGTPEPARREERRRWIALAVLCLGQLMMVLDATIVNVALPSIQRDLHFTQGNLTWVLDGYLITFGGFLLLAGRLGDLIGRKKVFLSGLVLFTAASVLCGVAQSQTMLIVARLVQGVGGAVASSVILAIIVTEFPRAREQAKAMGLYAFVSAGGGSIGLLAGGALTQSLDWHWIFFVNVPIGVVAFVFGWALIEENEGIGLGGGVDVLGSILITLATMFGAFAIVKSTEYGLLSARTLGVAGASVALLVAFILLESRIANPIMPLRILRLRMLMGSSLVRGLLVTGMFSAFFLGSLYLERVLGYDAIDTGLAFLPLTISIAVMSIGVAARAVARFGPLRTLACGLVGIVAGLLLLGGQGVHASYFPGLFFAFLLIGLGAGASFLPLLTMGMADAPRRDAGLASGIINVSVQLFGAIGLATLGTIATDHAKALSASGDSLSSALTGGYHLAYTVAAGCVAMGILAAFVLLRPPTRALPVQVEDYDGEHAGARSLPSAQPA